MIEHTFSEYVRGWGMQAVVSKALSTQQFKAPVNWCLHFLNVIVSCSDVILESDGISHKADL